MKPRIQENQSDGTSRKSGSAYQQLPYTEPHNNGADGAQGNKKKKLLIGGSVGLLAIVAIILVIVFATKGKTDDGGDKPGPGPGPGPGPVPDGFNPYFMDPDEQNTTVESQTGVLLFDNTYPDVDTFAASKKSSQIQDGDFAGIQTKNVVHSRGVNNDYIPRVRYAFGQSSYKRTVLSLTDDDDETRFDIPEDVVPKQTGQYQYRLDMADFHFQPKPFSFQFKSTRTGETLIDTTDQTFVFQRRFIQIDFKIPGSHIYGFGERETSFELGQGAWTMWPQDTLSNYDMGMGGKQLAGMHPFCLIKSNVSDEFFGIYFRSSNAQSPIVSFENNQHILRYITTGGNLDINFFFRGSAKEIIAEYQSFIGFPKLPPFWAMGWHVSGNGLESLEEVKDIVSKYNENNVPLESVWLDGKYMDGFSTFTVGKNFSDLKTYTNELHDNGKKMVVTLYGGLAFDEQHQSKYVGLAYGSLLKDMNGSKPFQARTYSNSTVFLDWFQKNASDVWAEGLLDMWDQLVEFDGVWLDMNTPTTFCEGGFPLCVPVNETARRKLVANEQASTNWYTSYGKDFMGENNTYYLPFIPQIANLDHQTVSLNATHNGTKNFTLRNITHDQYDVHSLFGHMQSMVTHKILTNESWNHRNNSDHDLRRLISSTSTYAGTGQYAAHNLAKMTRSWEHMKYSIAQIMNFNMFGIPFTGADVCGNRNDYVNQTIEEQYEICARWYQLSTFYPMARTNRDNGETGIEIQPFDLPNTNNYNMIARYSVLDRYTYARFVYGCLFDSSTTGQTCFDPLLFHYPELALSYTDIENTFMVGDVVKVSPILKSLKENETYEAFFPKGRWVDLDTMKVVEVTNIEGAMMTLTPQITVKKHLKPGGIVPLQYNFTADGQQELASSIDQLAFTNMNLIINRDDQGYAEGKLFVDEGKNTSELTKKDYEQYQFKMVNKTLQKLTLNTDYIATGRQNLASIVIADAENLKESAHMKACLISRSEFKSVDLANPIWNEESKTLTITSQGGEPINIYQMQAIVLRDQYESYSLCDMKSAGWHVDPTTYDPAQLETENALITLVSDKYPDLNMSLSLKLGGVESRIVNMKIMPQLVLGSDIFEVPEDIVDVQNAVQECNGENCELSKFVKINMSPNPDFLVTIQNGQQITPIDLWQLNSFIQDDFVNLFDAQTFSGTDEKYHGILGLAERTSNDLFLGDGVYSLWTRDEPNPIERGELPASNNYGVHPFYMTQANDSSWFGVYTNLAHAQDWWIANDNVTGVTSLSTIATGGILDVSFVFGDNPIEVTKEYHKIVGAPVLTPQWALGWHQCKWGYKNVDELRDVIANYQKYNLPLDTIWSDIDYMDAYKDFTFDPVNYKDLPQFVDDVHNQSMQYIPIVDAGIAQRQDSDYSAYNTGVEKDVFIKAYIGGPDFTGEVWPVDAVYPNFFKPETNDWWKDQLTSFYQTIKFDGLWQDMNEASNFCNGICYTNQAAEEPSRHKIPYTPTGRNLETKSMPLDAYHSSGPIDKNVTELDAHSLFGTMQVKASHEWFQSQDRRTMIIERSSFAGLGKFGSRWLGDNFSQYNYMGFSVTGVMMHNIIGIPLAGSDICGFIGDTTPELCVRWYQVGAYYPFSRNHNNLNQVPQEPYRFHDKKMDSQRYTDMIRNAMQIKLSLVPYYYTEMGLVSADGGPVYRPLFFDFPNDPNAYMNQTHNVMIGSGMKVSFQSTEDVNKTHYYFPDGIWCSIFNESAGCIDGPATVEMDSRIYQSFAHIKDGAILPLQRSVVKKNMTVTKVQELQQRPTELHLQVQLNELQECVATGRFLNDDGKVLKTTGKQNYYQFDFKSTVNCGLASRNADGSTFLNITQIVKATDLTPMNATINDFLGKIVIYNTNSNNFQMTGSYDVTVNYVDSSKPAKKLDTKAEFNPKFDQTVFEGWTDAKGETNKYDIPLFDVASLVFTPAA